MRATFQIQFSGSQDQQEDAVALLGQLLTEAGHFFDEDWTTAIGQTPAIHLRTDGAVRAALTALPRLGAYLVETTTNEII